MKKGDELGRHFTKHIEAEDVLLDQRDLGRRVTVSVEVYDTKGTSKRGHAATFAEAVEQVKAMMEKHDAQAQQEAERTETLQAMRAESVPARGG